jgi:hypothetical protein
MCLESFDFTGSILLDSPHPLASNDVHIWQCVNNIPCTGLLKCADFFMHSLFPLEPIWASFGFSKSLQLDHLSFSSHGNEDIFVFTTNGLECDGDLRFWGLETNR